MKKILYKAALVLSSAMILNSCDLDEYNPAAGDTSLTLFSAWSGLVVKCYTPLYEQMFSATDYLSVAETGTDTWLVKANGTNTKELFYYEGLTTNTNGTSKLFTQCYSMIASCNSVINEASNLVDGNEADIKVLIAEAKCLRAYYYSVLVTHYGPVTLNLQSVRDIELSPVRSTEAEIYVQIIQDLKEAFEDLGIQPYRGNYARVTKKTALGLLARVYAQGAGLDLKDENGISYWQLARDTAVKLINEADSYGAYLHTDVSDMWADDNNRNNKEALFIAAGPQADNDSFQYATGNNKLGVTMGCSLGSLEEFWTSGHKPSDKGNFLYGRMNAGVYMPSKYLMDCFEPSWDKRWENSFTHAYTEFSMEQKTSNNPVGTSYNNSTLTLTAEICEKYNLNPAFIGEKIYPYADCEEIGTTFGGGTQYPASVWPKGEYSGDPGKLIKPKKVYVIDYPVAEDDDRFNIICSKEYMTQEEKWKRKSLVVNIDDLYEANGLPKSTPFDGTNSYQIYPSFNKFSWSYYGVFKSTDLQTKFGDMYIMRMGEVYLIAAEAETKLGNGTEAAKYLNVLRERAVRDGVDKSTVRLTNVTMEDIFDEYARELCGEFSRWALLKRHHAFEERLQAHNIRAYESFKPDLHYNRPISFQFLGQISNKEQYGDNGYGNTVNSGLIK